MIPKLDQIEIEARNRALRADCAEKMHQLRQAKVAFPAPPVQSRDLLVDFAALESFSATLTNLSAYKAPAATPVCPVTVAAGAAVAPLSATEIEGLNWTARVRYAVGKLTSADARAMLVKATKPALSATERILKARGVSNLTELRASRAATVHPNLD